MDRRGFLKKFGIGVAAVATVAAAPELCSSLFPYAPQAGVVGGYADYVNFSNLAIAEGVDEAVANAAAELGRRAGLSMVALWERTYDADNSAV